MTVEQEAKCALYGFHGEGFTEGKDVTGSLVVRTSVVVARGSLSLAASVLGTTAARALRGFPTVSLVVGTTVVAADPLRVALRTGTSAAGSEPGDKALPQSLPPVREADRKADLSELGSEPSELGSDSNSDSSGSESDSGSGSLDARQMLWSTAHAEIMAVAVEGW